MRRTILSAAVLCFIAAPDLYGQSIKAKQQDCRNSASCGRSYFDYLVETTGAITFDFFLLTFDGGRRQSAKRTLTVSPVTSRVFRGTDAETGPSDWRNAVNETPRAGRAVSPRSASAREDLERTNTLALSWWDWLASARAADRSEFADDTPKPDNSAERPREEKAAQPGRGDDAARGNDSPDGGKGEVRESPRKPDVPNNDRLDDILTPEPSTLLLIGSALPLALGFIRARRRR